MWDIVGLILFCLYFSVSVRLFNLFQGPDCSSRGSCVACVVVNLSIHCFLGRGHSDFFTLSSSLSHCALQMLSIHQHVLCVAMQADPLIHLPQLFSIVQHCALMPSLMHLKAVLDLFHLSRCLPSERLVNRCQGLKCLTAQPPGPSF